MGKFTSGDYTPPSAEEQAASGPLLVDIGGTQYEVLDGDTIREYGVEGAPGLRVQGLTAPETFKPDYDEGIGAIRPGVGAEEAKTALYQVIQRGNFNTITDQGEQEVGGGAGLRKQIRITNDKGEDLTDKLYEIGVADQDPYWTDQNATQAAALGRLERELQGTSDGYQDLRDEYKQARPLVFKGLALNEEYYDSDYHTGVAFRHADRNLDGSAISPVSSAWDLGWANTQADFAASLHLLGEVTGSEWLDTVSRKQLVNAQSKIAGSPKFKVQSLSDISENSEDYSDYIFNTLEWAAVNGTMSLPYMGALVGGAVVATPLVAGAATALGAGTAVASASGFAAGVLPSVALHTGSTWNQVDNENRTRENAGKAVAAGLGAALLDRFALGKIIKPTQLLTKEGREQAVKYIANRDGISEDAARVLFNRAAKQESTAYLRYAGQHAADQIEKAKYARSVLTGFANAAPVEAVTEVGQELTTYLTAQHINGEEADMDYILELAANAGAAGGLLGGAFGATGGAWASNGRALTRKQLQDFDTENINPYARVYLENQEDGAISDQIHNGKVYKRRDGYEEGYFSVLATEGDAEKGFLDQFKDENGDWTNLDPISGLGAAFNYAARLVKAPVLNFIRPEDLATNPFARQIVGRFTNTRGIGGPGRHFEARKDFLESTFNTVLDETRMSNENNLIADSPGQQRNWSQKFIRANRDGLVRKARSGQLVTDADLEASNLTRREFDGILQTSIRADNGVKAMFEAELEAIKQEYGKDSKEAQEFSKQQVDEYFWKHRSISRQKVAGNTKAFTEFLQRKMNEFLNDPTKSQEDKKRVSAKSAAQRTADILSGKLDDDFSLVEGVKWSGRNQDYKRLLDISEDAEFEDFANDSFIENYRDLSDNTAKRISHLEYAGDGGSDLDYYFKQAIDYDVNVLGKDRQQTLRKYRQLARVMKGAIDATSGNYNRIQNETAAAVQRNILSFTSAVMLPFAGLASFPEFMTVLTDVSNAGEARTALMAQAKALGSRYKESLDASRAKASRRLGFEAEQGRSQLQDVLNFVGIEQSPYSLYNKLGIDQGISNHRLIRWYMDTFFGVTQLNNVTQAQRQASAAFASDFALERLALIANKTDPDAPFTEEQGRAYEALRALGMDVPKVLSLLQQDRPLTREDLTINPDPNAPLSPEQEILREEMGVLTQNFVNERIQNPGAFNRSLVFQDPRFALFTHFNGFISTVTTTLVPKLWKDGFFDGIRQRNPAITISAAATMVAMIGMGWAGQWLRDYIKFGGENPYLADEQIAYRALLSSGIFGQYEKVLQTAVPLYDFDGDGLVGRALGDLRGPSYNLVEQVIEGSKDLVDQQVTTPSGETYTREANVNRALNHFIKNVPLIGALPRERGAVVDWLTGKNE